MKFTAKTFAGPLFAATLTAAAAASPLSAHAEVNDPVEFCAGQGELAKTIMQVRQGGASMMDMLKVLAAPEDATEGQQEASKLATRLVQAAFTEPRYSTEEMQTRAVEDFRNGIESACFEAVTGGN